MCGNNLLRGLALLLLPPLADPVALADSPSERPGARELGITVGVFAASLWQYL